tara:strand:+ start:21 stop:2669 length:2649 start_codon:yes stop_codon:yes gene_type:complete
MRLTFDSSKENNKVKHRQYKYLPIVLVSLLLGVYLGWKNIPGILKAKFIFFSQSEFLPSITEKNDLKNIQININFKNFNRIKEKRSKAIQNMRLISSNEDYVKASIIEDDVLKPCNVRLKGDLPDHWLTSKWSLRVKMKGENLVSGMSRFSIQNPMTRSNTLEWLFLETLRKEGLMGVRYDFVNIVINGKNKGIYAIEEYISKEFVESNNRRDGVVISLDEELMWNSLHNKPTNLEWNSIYRTAGASALNDGRIEKNPLLTRQKTTAINLLRDLQVEKIKPEELFDCEKLGKFFAICRIWNAEQCLDWDDMNFYFNPIIGKFEPIGFDASPENGKKSPYCLFTKGKVFKNWVNYALESPIIAESYVRHLRIFSSENYIKELKNAFLPYEIKIRRLISRDLMNASLAEFWQNFKSIFNNDPWEALSKRVFSIRQELAEQMPALGYARIKKDSLNYEITLRNSLTQPVEFLGIKSTNCELNASKLVHLFDDLKDLFFLPNKSIILPIQQNGKGNNFSSINFSLPRKLIDLNQSNHENSLLIQLRLLGNDNVLSMPLPVDQNIYNPDSLPFKSKDLSLDPEVFSSIGDTIFIHPGTHTIYKDIHVSHGMRLKIGPKTSLLFERNASIIVEGSIMALGTAEHPIILSSSKDLWDGLLLFNSKNKSVFENVLFSNLAGNGKLVNSKGIERDGWVMTGGINVLDSQVHFSSCEFTDCYTEDALNIFSSSFFIKDCIFQNCVSDGFDGDFVDGIIDNCKFIHVGGDGIDISGSSVSVNQSIFYDVKDKAISIGEASVASVNDVTIDKANFGIVSKDLSQTRCENSLIKNIVIAGVSCYQKKNAFGPGKLNLSEVSFENLSKPYLIQDGSSAIADGENIQTESFSTSSLY